MTYVSSRERVVLLQNYEYPGLLKWEWDGDAWRALDSLVAGNRDNSPELYDAAVAYDDRRDRVVVFKSTFSYSALYEWDGSTWMQVDAAPQPHRRGGVLAYDGVRGKIVLFGGVDPVLQDTWEWDGTSWTQVPTLGAAPAPGGKMAYDSLRSKLVMVAPDGTWELEASTWTKRVSTNAPAFSSGAAMVYDSARDRMVFLSDGVTWEWDGTDWSARSDTTPAVIYKYEIAYDSPRGKVVLFTGVNETWDWDGTNWTLRVRVPPPMQLHSMAYDEARGETVLFGRGETWLWNGTRWEQRIVTPSPEGSGSMAYDSVRERVVLLAGDIWEWDGTSWTQVTASESSGPAGGIMAYDSQRGVMVVFGGDVVGASAVSSATWEWNGSSWTRRAPSNQPPPCSDCGIAYDSLRGLTVVTGQFGNAPYVGGTTWLWDGTDWTLAPAAYNPAGQVRPGMAYDACRDRVVSIATWRNYGGAYAWTGDASTSWQGAGGVAPTRDWTAMAYDTRRKVLVLYGGRHATLASYNVMLLDTWETAPDGATCIEDCPSRRFVDGVCCNTQASTCGECHACNVPGSIGTCVPTPGAGCDDGDECTTQSSCRGTECVGEAAVVCEPSTEECAQVGACDPATGQCSKHNLPDRTPCANGTAQCRDGVCVNRCVPESCVATVCFVPEACDVFEGCVGQNAEDGTPCIDDRLLAQGSCMNGSCIAVNPCAGVAEGTSCTIWTDPPQLGNCFFGYCGVNHCYGKEDGTPCEDQPNGTCLGGYCSSPPFVCSKEACGEHVCRPFAGCMDNSCTWGTAEGAPCDDGDPCTRADACRDGVCTGTTSDCADAGSGEPDAGVSDASIEDGGSEPPDASGAMDSGSAGADGGDGGPGHHHKPWFGRRWHCHVSEAHAAGTPDNSVWMLVGAATLLVARVRRRRGRTHADQPHPTL